MSRSDYRCRTCRTVLAEVREERGNLRAACKWGLDQLQGVVITDDRQLVFEPVAQERSPDGVGRTMLDLWQDHDPDGGLARRRRPIAP